MESGHLATHLGAEVVEADEHVGPSVPHEPLIPLRPGQQQEKRPASQVDTRLVPRVSASMSFMVIFVCSVNLELPLTGQCTFANPLAHVFYDPKTHPSRTWIFEPRL